MFSFREKLGRKVTRALKRDSEAITHAAIDMICALMQPMHQDYDLHREQLNKSSLLSTHSFLKALLDMWVNHIVSISSVLSKIFFFFFIRKLYKMFECLLETKHWCPCRCCYVGYVNVCLMHSLQ